MTRHEVLTPHEALIAESIAHRVASQGYEVDDALALERSTYVKGACEIHWGRTKRHAEQLVSVDRTLARCRRTLAECEALGW